MAGCKRLMLDTGRELQGMLSGRKNGSAVMGWRKRSRFAWANTLFAELLDKLIEERGWEQDGFTRIIIEKFRT